MEYAIPLFLALLVVTAVIVLLLMRSMRTRDSTGKAFSDGPGIGADNQSPTGDTEQHAGQQEGGETVGNADAGQHGGAGQRHGAGYTGTQGVGDDEEDRHVAAHVQRPGEGEGATRF